VVIATEKKLAELIDSSSIQKINNLTPQIGVVYAGLGADSRLLLRKGRKSAQSYRLQYGVCVNQAFGGSTLGCVLIDRCWIGLQQESVPVLQLVREQAAVMQEFTQSGYVLRERERVCQHNPWHKCVLGCAF
jgi:20S proteasome subunit alpha 2